MKLAAIVKCHGNTSVVTDTLDSLMTHMTKDVLVVIDGQSWERWGKHLELPVYKMAGFPQGNSTSMYRNVTLALKQVLSMWPDSDWICCCDYDVLFASDSYKKDLEAAEVEGAWCVGFDMFDRQISFPYLESIVGEQISCSKYSLGCCMFFHRKFLEKLASIDFFDRLLTMTNDFSSGFFPGCEDVFDFGEHLFPTLAVHLGGKLKELLSWNTSLGFWWRGDCRKYQVRFRPDIEINEVTKQSSILHPLKEWNADVRTYFRELRRRRKLANIQ